MRKKCFSRQATKIKNSNKHFLIIKKKLNITNSLILIINIFLASLLLISSIAGNTTPSHALLVQPTTLIYPILFIANLILLFYWLLLRSRFAIISAIVTIIGVGHITSNFQFTVFDSSKKLADDTKVISFNVQNFGEREKNKINTPARKDIISFLANEDADIVCLQEYHSTNTNLYEPIKEIRDTLRMTSYYYESYYNPKYNQLLGIVTFSKYDAINKGKLKFDGSRTFGIYTDLIIYGDTVRIFNIHLASIKLQPADLDFVTARESEDSKKFRSSTSDIYYKLTQAYKLREKQLNFLVNIIKSTPYKIIICGDFNDTPSSWVYRQLNNHLSDTFVRKGRGVSPTYAGPIPFLRIDYILTSDEIKTKNFKRYEVKKSDHYPISAIIRIP